MLLNNTGGQPLGTMCRSILGILHEKPFSAPKMGIVDTLLADRPEGIFEGSALNHSFVGEL